MIERKRLRVRARGRPKEVPGDLKSVNIMVEIGRFKEFREMCEEVGVTTSEGIRQLIDKEMEQKNQVGTAKLPIAVAYSTNTSTQVNQCNRQQTLISFFGKCSTVRDVICMLKDERVEYDQFGEFDRCYRNLGDGLTKYRCVLSYAAKEGRPLTR